MPIDTKSFQKYQIGLSDKKIVSIEFNGREVESFEQPATKSKLPKLYLVRFEGKVIYIGITSQSMRNRLRYGLQAKGAGGYHGYKWKHLRQVELFIWCFPKEEIERIEALEAELVYLFRKNTGKWPAYQNEIHFRNASADEINAAEAIFSAVIKPTIKGTFQKGTGKLSVPKK